MHKKSLLLIMFVCLLLTGCLSEGIEENSPNRYVAYASAKHTQRALENNILDKATHVNLYFVNPDVETGKILFKEKTQKELHHFVAEAHKKGVKVIISIGGGLGLEDKLTNPIYLAFDKWLKKENRATLIQNYIDLINEYNFDGIDNDLEDVCITSTYNPFVLEMREALDKTFPDNPKLWTAAVAPYTSVKISGKALHSYDFLNLMSYDHTVVSRPPGPVASWSRLKSELIYYCDIRRIHPHKIVIGVPFYGYWWSKTASTNFEWGNPRGAITFETIYETLLADLSTEELFALEDKTILPNTFLDLDGNEIELDSTLFYSSPKTILEKTLFAKKFGGVMSWNYHYDTPENSDAKVNLSDIIIENL